MENVVAIVALIKLAAVLIMFGTFLYGVAVESDAKRKFTEIMTTVIILAVLMGMQFLIPRMAGANAQTLRDACTAWDPTPLFQTS
jgi:ABC-type Na+ efflux pump permease subunit